MHGGIFNDSAKSLNLQTKPFIQVSSKLTKKILEFGQEKNYHQASGFEKNRVRNRLFVQKVLNLSCSRLNKIWYRSDKKLNSVKDDLFSDLKYLALSTLYLPIKAGHYSTDRFQFKFFLSNHFGLQSSL